MVVKSYLTLTMSENVCMCETTSGKCKINPLLSAVLCVHFFVCFEASLAFDRSGMHGKLNFSGGILKGEIVI